VIAARAKGLSETRIIWRHALRNAMVPLVTVIALSYAGLLEGSVLTETVFAWPGLGLYITNSLQNADMNAVLGGTIVVGSIFIGLNLLSDLLYRAARPADEAPDEHAAPERPARLADVGAAAVAPPGLARPRLRRLAHLRAQPAGDAGPAIVLALVCGDLRRPAAPYSPYIGDLERPGCCRPRRSTGSAPTTRAATSCRA
jgi:hypothetical protein